MNKANMNIADVSVGQELPAIRVPVTITSVMATAVATRDYQPVHHDLMLAQANGSETVFTNTHTAAGYLERLVMQWAGPNAFLKRLKFRMGGPNYAGDELILKGKIIACDTDSRCVTVAAVGTNAHGDHVTGEVVVQLAEGIA